jgi:hypothetical protein
MLVKTDVRRIAQKPTEALFSALRAGFGAPDPRFRFCAAAVMQLAFQIFYATNYSALLGYFGAYRKRHFRDNAKKLDLERENCHLPIID